MRNYLTAGSPGIQPLLPLIGIAGAIILFVIAMICLAALRNRILRLASQLASRETITSNLAAELEAQALLARQMSIDLEELRKRLLEHHETGQSEATLWMSGSMPVNLNRRGQILRLSRKGKSVAEIAHDLNVAQGEVELLLKVHDLSQNIPGRPS